MIANRRSLLIWSTFLVVAFLALALQNGTLYGLAVPLAALAVAYAVPGALPDRRRHGRHRIDTADLIAVGAFYVGVVALFTLAFRVFTQDAVAGLFLSFAGGMLLGVVGPVIYTERRGRSLADLGLTRKNLKPALALGVVLAAVQFSLTLWRYDLPAASEWVPLLALALTVGAFESVFFRGFVQTRLEASLGPVPGIGCAAALYALYHVGYGMGPRDMIFLFGLGVVYAVAYAVVRNILVLWPLLTPLGSFYSNLQGGEIRMPWIAIFGFVDVLALMVTAIWLAARRERRAQRAALPQRPHAMA
ncbi:MAG TPA: CPBP family intramembrane glutamic endopeptidase [Actinomycetales bacterium]|nr:CPBP family intramembrane glutamic endopeptidase [Actinomycetales bacterium]